MTERIRKCPDALKWQARILASAVITPDGCWEWTGPLDRHGYGKFNVRIGAAKRMTGAHRAAWLAFEGEIDGDLVIDHLCRNTLCVNTAHLDLVSNAVNALRGDHSNKAGRSGRPRRLHGTEPHSCLKHGREDGYLIEGGDGYVRWTCRICRRERTARYRAARRSQSRMADMMADRRPPAPTLSPGKSRAGEEIRTPNHLFTRLATDTVGGG